MGTSKGYNMPTGGDWTPLKNEATRFVTAGGTGSVSHGDLLRSYLRANGGASAIAHDGGAANTGAGRGGAGRGGGGGGGRGGRAARSVARNLGGFLGSVANVGLSEALREIGLGDFVGRPAAEVTAALLDAFAAPGSTLDEQAAREALVKLNDELLEDAQTYEEVEQVFSEALDKQGLVRILASFFGHYLFERFLRDFYENWMKKVGGVEAARCLNDIKDYIESRISAKLTGRDVAGINWRGRQGLRLTQEVMQETLEIFEV